MVARDLSEARNFLDADPIGIDPLLGWTTVWIFDITNRDDPRLVSVSQLPLGPREDPPEFKENQLVMENSVTNLPWHCGVFASTMAGGAIFYTPDFTDPHPAVARGVRRRDRVPGVPSRRALRRRRYR